MAEIMGVSRPAVREVLRALELLGIVKPVPGGGNYITENLDTWLIGPLSILFKLNNGYLRQNQQFRAALERETAILAARKCTPLDAAELWVISRAGANAICELLALHKPNILIPLSLEASRGDQILNAASFEKQGFSYVIKEEELTSEKLLAAITSVDENKETYKQAMSQSNQQDAVVKVADIIEKACK